MSFLRMNEQDFINNIWRVLQKIQGLKIETNRYMTVNLKQAGEDEVKIQPKSNEAPKSAEGVMDDFLELVERGYIEVYLKQERVN